jgi:hypothetical protein
MGRHPAPHEQRGPGTGEALFSSSDWGAVESPFAIQLQALPLTNNKRSSLKLLPESLTPPSHLGHRPCLLCPPLSAHRRDTFLSRAQTCHQQGQCSSLPTRTASSGCCSFSLRPHAHQTHAARRLIRCGQEAFPVPLTTQSALHAVQIRVWFCTALPTWCSLPPRNSTRIALTIQLIASAHMHLPLGPLPPSH